MTDRTPTGEPPGGEQTTGKPTPPVNPPSEKQTSKDSGVTLEMIASRLDQIERSVGKRQSGKDKAIHDLQGEVNDLKGIIGRYTSLVEGGLASEDALFRMQVEDYMNANPKERVDLESPSAPADRPKTPSVDPQVTITAAGLDPSDPQVTEILNREEDPTAALLSLASSRKRGAAPTTVMSTGGGETVPEPELREQYLKEVAPHRGNIRKVSQIQAEYRRKGLDV